MHRLSAGAGILFAVGGGAWLIFIGATAMWARGQRRRDPLRTWPTRSAGMANADDVLRRGPYVAIAAFLMMPAGVLIAVTAGS